MKRNTIFCVCLFAITALLSFSSGALSVESPQQQEKPKDKAAKYESSAERLNKEAANLEKRRLKLPEAQQEIALQLAAAKRDLAQLKIEAASLWKKHLGDLPDEFKARLKSAQTNHSELEKEYYRIGRKIKEAKKAPASTNSVATASVTGK